MCTEYVLTLASGHTICYVCFYKRIAYVSKSNIKLAKEVSAFINKHSKALRSEDLNQLEYLLKQTSVTSDLVCKLLNETQATELKREALS